MTVPPALDTVYLTELSPTDKPWDLHRGQSEAVEALYGQGGYEKYRERIKDCSRRLQFALVKDGSGGVVFHLEGAKFCRVRFCPICQWRRSLMWRARFFKAMPEFLADHPSFRPIFLTLTVSNCPITELRSTVDDMQLAFKRMSSRKKWPGEAWVKSLEVTRGQDGSAHPHYHVLMFVRPGYFSQGYIKQAEWRQLWKEAMRLNYLPVVNVKTVKPKKSQDVDSPLEAIRVAILETLKYGVKPDDLVKDSEWLWGLTQQLHKTRAVAVGGLLRNYLRDSEPEDLISGEDPDGDLEVTEADPRLVFDWLTEVKKYAKRM